MVLGKKTAQIANAAHAPCEHVECRLGVVKTPWCWVENGAHGFIECYDTVFRISLNLV